MKRIQLYLGPEEIALLDREGDRTGASRSELIRRAIHHRYGGVAFEARRAAVRETAGGWRGRTYSGEEYVDTIRKDLNDRLDQLGGT